MISAFMVGLSRQREPLDVPVKAEDRAAGGEDGAIPRQESDPHKAAPAEDLFGSAIGSDSHDTAAPSVRCGDVEIPFAVEREPLRPAQSSKKGADLALLIDAKHAIETRGCRPCNEQFPSRAEREM